MAFSAGYGFDSIALALLGKSHPFGVVLAALLFGTLRSGGTRMQNVAKIPVDIIGSSRPWSSSSLPRRPSSAASTACRTQGGRGPQAELERVRAGYDSRGSNSQDASD